MTKRVRPAVVVTALIVAATGRASSGDAGASSDVDPPVTTVTVLPTPDYGGYYYALGTAINVVLAATGVASTEYRLNGGAWTPYGSAVEIVEPVGEYVLDYRSTDGVGNVEDAKSIRFGVAELPLPALPGVPGTPFSDGGSWIYHYPSRPEPYDYSGQTWAYDPTTLPSIIADLQSGWYTERGITNLMMYGPYWATGEFRGLPALRDFMDIDPEIGTIREWRDMVSLANSQGITVTTYLAVPYIHAESTLFVKAQEDRRDNVMSFERSIFRWDERVPEGSNPPPGFGGTGTPPSNASVPRPSQGNWAWSPIANRWYATAWGHPAIDFEGGGMEFMKSVVRFWMDNGVQGIEWDAPQSVWGLSNSDARHREVVTYADTYRPDWENYIHGEGLCAFGNQAICDRAGHTHILLNGDDDFNSFATRVGRIPQTLTPDQLDLHWQSFHDHRQLLGRGTYSWSLYDYDVAAGLRALDAAVQAGSGAQYSIDFPMMVRNPKNDVLPEATLELVWDVHRALRNSRALSPSASRERVLTNIDQGSGNFRGYAVLRRSAETDDAALNIYNFDNAEKCVTLDLTGTGITFPQRTTDLATGEPGPWVLSSTSSFRLPAYGWQFLDVSVEPAFPWTIVDDLDSGWTWGSVWAPVTDASSFGGTRRHGNGTTAPNAANAWGEIMFTGRSVQGYGRMATGSDPNTGATTAVEVFIDGVSQGIHSQRRANDEGTADGERQGRLLFSISGLAAGEHTLRIQQVGTTTANGGPSGIDYIKVSDRDYVAPAPPAGGDRCQSDVTPPITTLHGEARGGVPGVSISLEANDPDPEPSGVARVEYRINGGAWIEYEHIPFQLTGHGDYAVEYRSIDVAGNVEQTHRTMVFPGTNGKDAISGTASEIAG